MSARRPLLALSAGLLAMAAAQSPAAAGPLSDDPSGTGTIKNQGATGAIDGSYTVVLKGEHSRSKTTAKAVSQQATSLTKTYGGKVSHTYSAALRGFSVKISGDAARKLAADPAVDYVSQNTKVKASETWGLDRIDQEDLPLDDSYKAPNDGADSTVYVVDTGLDMTHPDFEGRAKSGPDFVDGDDDSSDCQGHGTHVAGTVGSKTYGVAKKTNLVGVRVLDCQGSGSTDAITKAIDWVTQNAPEASVGNMSLGGGKDPALDDAVENSTKGGVVWAVAAGNETSDACNVSPGGAPSAYTTGSTDETDKLSDFSNYGECVDINAPGTDITSTSNGGGTEEMSGTSMASPHAAGALAVARTANTGGTPEDAMKAVSDGASSDKIDDPNGSPNLLLNVSNLG